MFDCLSLSIHGRDGIPNVKLKAGTPSSNTTCSTMTTIMIRAAAEQQHHKREAGVYRGGSM
jgi:hypothetical protein